jgi:hypothetical protein
LTAYSSKIIKNISDIAGYFIQAIDDEEKLRTVCFEKDYEGRDALQLLSDYEIVEIMNNRNMEKVALELWASEYDVKGSIMTTSSAFNILKHDMFKKPKDVVNDYIFFSFKNRIFHHHLYQVNIWKKSMMAKVVMEGIFLALLACVF